MSCHRTKWSHSSPYEAIYQCTYSASHPESGASKAVSIRGGGEGTDNAVKECVSLEWRNADRGPGCMVMDADKTSWVRNHILGRMLSREEAITSDRGYEAFAITNAIWTADHRLPNPYAGQSNNRTTLARSIYVGHRN